MKTWLRDHRGFIVFLILFGTFRTAIADWNPVPSGSMRPTILEGDVVLVNRLAFDLKVPLTDIVMAHLGEPQRGDVVTFSSPKDGIRLIKRLIALPGDTVEMRDGALILNGRRADYRAQGSVREPLEQHANTIAQRLSEQFDEKVHRIQMLPEIDSIKNFGPVLIPSGQYLMLGDNRDNSADSRYFGLVPRNLLIGRAERILVSADIKGNWQPRASRFGMPLK